MLILETHSLSFLSIFQIEPNLSEGYKKSVCSVCYKTVSMGKNSN